MFDEQLAYLFLQLTALPQDGANQEQPTVTRVHYDLILDVSGSMNADSKYLTMLQAIREFSRYLGKEHSLSVYTFSHAAENLVDTLTGNACQDAIQTIDELIRSSPNFFGGRTLLAPAVQLCLSNLHQRNNDMVKRAFILTDGELHDPDNSRVLIAKLGAAGYEIALYGFGSQFDAEQLWHVIELAPGATAKSLLDISQAGYAFGHWARQGQRIVAHDLCIDVKFEEDIVCGNVYMTEPIERELGAIERNIFRHELRTIEWNRSYGFLCELRLPPSRKIETPVSILKLSMAGADTFRHEIVAPRHTTDGKEIAEVTCRVQAFMEKENSKEMKIRSLRARITLYQQQGRSKKIIDAIYAKISEIESDGLVKLSANQEQELAADAGTERSVLTSARLPHETLDQGNPAADPSVRQEDGPKESVFNRLKNFLSRSE